MRVRWAGSSAWYLLGPCVLRGSGFVLIAQLGRLSVEVRRRGAEV